MSPVKVVVLAVLVGIGFWMVLVSACLADDWLGGVLNLGTELMGAGLIYLILHQFIGSRERREAAEMEMEAHKKDLIARMGRRSVRLLMAVRSGRSKSMGQRAGGHGYLVSPRGTPKQLSHRSVSSLSYSRRSTPFCASAAFASDLSLSLRVV